MDTLLIILGAATYWDSACIEQKNWSESCKIASRQLQYTDEDAFRMAWLWSGTPTLIFTAPDAETAAWPLPDGQSFASHITGPPTQSALLSALRTLPEATKKREIVLYIAAHGTPAGVFLDDGVILPRELMDAIEQASNATIKLVLADACDYGLASTRGDEEFLSRIGRSPGNYTEASALSSTKESPNLKGGYFTLLLGTAIIGGAGTTPVSGDLEQFLYSYTPALPTDFLPQLLSPAGSTQTPILVPESSTGLLFPATPVPTRWSVSIPTPSGELFISDLLGIKAETIRLPPGKYKVWRTSYVQRGGQYRMDDRNPSAVCSLELSDGVIDVGLCAFLPVQTMQGRGEGGIGGAAPEYSSLISELGPPLSVGETAWSFHRHQTMLTTGIGIQAAFLGRDEPMVGGELGLRGGLGEGRLQGWLMVGGFRELGQVQPSDAMVFTLQPGILWGMVASRAWRLDLELGLGGELAWLWAERGSLTESGVLSAINGHLGIGGQWSVGGRGMVGLSGFAQPGVFLVPEGEGIGLVYDWRRVGLVVRAGARL